MTVAVENVRVFILAENRLLREALTRILRKKGNIDVVGASALAPQVTEQVTAAAPDVLLSDSAAMSLAELRLIPELRAALPGLKVVHDWHGRGPRNLFARGAGRSCRLHAEGRIRSRNSRRGSLRSR